MVKDHYAQREFRHSLANQISYCNSTDINATAALIILPKENQQTPHNFDTRLCVPTGQFTTKLLNSSLAAAIYS